MFTNMTEDFEEMLEIMDKTLSDFESGMPKPQYVKKSWGYVFRFEEPDIYTAIIQKLARVQSVLRATYLLWQNGYHQEQMILHRVLDETNEDIQFLVIGAGNEITDLHSRFLDAFWQEEFDEEGDALSSEQKRPMIPRQKIRAFLSSSDGVEDPHSGNAAARTISKTYSGYVHGASPQIMDLYGGDPPHFYTKGMLGTPRVEMGLEDLWNYMYRTFLSHIMVAKILGAEKHAEFLMEKKAKYEENAGKDYS